MITQGLLLLKRLSAQAGRMRVEKQSGIGWQKKPVLRVQNGFSDIDAERNK